MSDLYETQLLRRLAAGEAINDQVDWPNIIDEVETVGRSERAALRRHIATVIEHLIKLQAWPAIEPRNGWMGSVDRARSDIARSLVKPREPANWLPCHCAGAGNRHASASTA